MDSTCLIKEKKFSSLAWFGRNFMVLAEVDAQWLCLTALTSYLKGARKIEPL
jgi:hypothetical protein